MTPDAAVTTATRLGAASVSTLLALACLALVAAVAWLARENARLQEARRADTERLLTVQVAREGVVVTALGAITELPDVVRAIPDALRDVVRDELSRASEPGRRGR